MRSILIAIGFTLFAGPAFANAVLPLQGIFGNPSGCAFFLTGERSSDDVVVLTPDTFTTFGSGCYFEQLIEGGENGFTIAASCTAEGEERSTDETVVVIDQGEAGVLVELVGLDLFGPLYPCPGTADLFRRGVQV